MIDIFNDTMQGLISNQPAEDSYIIDTSLGFINMSVTNGGPTTISFEPTFAPELSGVYSCNSSEANRDIELPVDILITTGGQIVESICMKTGSP